MDKDTPPSAKMDDFSKDDMVDLVVGHDKQVFHVHASTIRAVPFFAKALDSGFAESFSRVITMPEDSAFTTYYLIKWLYTKELPPKTEVDEDKDHVLVIWTKLHCLADKFGHVKLMKEVEKAVCDGLGTPEDPQNPKQYLVKGDFSPCYKSTADLITEIYKHNLHPDLRVLFPNALLKHSDKIICEDTYQSTDDDDRPREQLFAEDCEDKACTRFLADFMRMLFSALSDHDEAKKAAKLSGPPP